MTTIIWYIKYFWIKLNIWILTPLVYIQNKYRKYKEERLKTYVEYICTIERLKTMKNK